MRFSTASRGQSREGAWSVSSVSSFQSSEVVSEAWTASGSGSSGGSGSGSRSSISRTDSETFSGSELASEAGSTAGEVGRWKSVACAVVAMAFVALCNFTFGRALDGAGAGAPYAAMHFAMGGSGAVGLAVCVCKVWMDGRWGEMKEAVVGGVSWKHQALVASAAVQSAAGVLSLNLAFDADQASKGAVVSLSAGSAAFAAVVSRIVFGERLSARQLGAIAVVTAGVVMIALATSRTASVLPIVFGFVTLVFFATSSLTIKWVVHNGGKLSSIHIIGLWAGMQAVLGVGVFAVRAATGSAFDGLSRHQAGLCLVAGILLGCGNVLYNVALKYGSAGVCLAISQANGACVLLLDTTVGLYPTLFQVAGIVVTLAGVMSLSVFSASDADDVHSLSVFSARGSRSA